MARSRIWAAHVFSLCTLLGAVHAQAQPSPPILVTIQPEFRSPGKSWEKKQCRFIQKSLAVASQGPVDVTCGSQGKGTFQYHLYYSPKKDGTAQLRIENLNYRDERDFKDLIWTIEKAPHKQQAIGIQKALTNFYKLRSNERMIEETALALGVQDGSQKLEMGANGLYYDRVTRKIVDFDEASRIYWDEKPANKNYSRAWKELVGALGIGFTAYWARNDVSRKDWEYKANWENFRARFYNYKAWRMDDNSFDLNVGHTLAGAAYYAAARYNNLNVLESFMLTFIGSLVWEMVVEYREVVSINDMVFTPLGGLTLGEALFQLGRHFDKGGDSMLNRTLAAVFDAPDKFHYWLDKNSPKRSSSSVLNSMGINNENGWHQFDIYGGIAWNKTSETGKEWKSYAVGFDSQLIHIPEYGKPGAVSRIISDTAFTQLMLRATFGDDGVRAFKLFSEAALYGWYKQNLKADLDQEVNGYTLYIGAATALDYEGRQTDHFREMKPRVDVDHLDHAAIANILGPRIDLTYFYQGFKVRATLDIFGDFAIVRSYAVDKFDAQNPSESTSLPSVVNNYRYYMAGGYTVTPGLTVDHDSLQIGAQLKFHDLYAFQGRERDHDKIVNDQSMGDKILRYTVWIAYTIPDTPIKIKLSNETTLRESYVGDVNDSGRDTSFFGTIAFTF